MTTSLPDGTLIVGDHLTDVPWSTRTPANLAGEVPCRTINQIGGKWSHPLFLDAPHIVINSFAATEVEARALGATARATLIAAWLAQGRSTHGVLHRLVEVISPFVVRTGTEPDGVAHVSSTYQVFTRP
jgi:hypothetical protein